MDEAFCLMLRVGKFLKGGFSMVIFMAMGDQCVSNNAMRESLSIAATMVGAST